MERTNGQRNTQPESTCIVPFKFEVLTPLLYNSYGIRVIQPTMFCLPVRRVSNFWDSNILTSTSFTGQWPGRLDYILLFEDMCFFRCSSKQGWKLTVVLWPEATGFSVGPPDFRKWWSDRPPDFLGTFYII